MKAWTVLPIVLLACCAAPPPGSEQQAPAEELVGRTAGAPQRCVMLNPQDGIRVSNSDRHTLLYGSGRVVYANHLGGSCGFRYDDVPVIEPFGTYLCRGDIVRSFDRTSHIPGPTCVLREFVPYTR